MERWSGREADLRRQRRALSREVAEARARGDVQNAPLLFGQDAGRFDEIVPVAEVVSRIVTQASEIIAKRLGPMLES